MGTPKVERLFLFVLTCFLCTFGGVQETTTTHQSSVKASCFIEPTMETAHCFPPTYEANKEDDYNTTYSIDETDSGKVSDGTLCVLNSGYPKAIKCQGGEWITSKIPGHIIERLSTEMDNKLLVRQKRWSAPVLTGHALLLSGGGGGGAGAGGKGKAEDENHNGNTKPTIVCPKIPPYWFPEKGKFEKLVTWDHATASDLQDGNLTTHLTQFPRGRTLTWPENKDGNTIEVLLPERSEPYKVSYMATDTRSESVTCSVDFHVTAHRCATGKDSISNGEVNCTHERIWGSTCTFTCDDSYKRVGDHSVTCVRNTFGTTGLGVQFWNASKPTTCQAVICRIAPKVTNGTYLGCTGRSVGDSCTLYCQDGYTGKGDKKIYCLPNGQWTTPGFCSDIKPPNFRCPADITTYTTSGNQFQAVSWKMPTASDNSGEAIVVTSNSSSGNGFPIGRNVVKFEGKDSKGNSKTCNMVINVKEKVSRCDVLEPPDHGSVTCPQSCAVGSTCVFSCLSGFSLQGASERKCLNTQAWSQSQPFCKPTSCVAPTTDPGSMHTFNCTNGTLFESICKLTCSPGYTLVGTPTTVCNSSSQWTAFGYCRDDTPPEFVFGCPPKYVELEFPRSDTTIVEEYLPRAMDNSNLEVKVTTNTSKVPLGSTVNVTAVATDLAGNVASCVFPLQLKRGECQNPYNTGIDTSIEKLMEFDCPDGYVHGAKCSLSCRNSQPLTGEIACVKTVDSLFEWVFTRETVCLDYQCILRNAPKYGHRSCSWRTSAQKVCTLYCHEGYGYPWIGVQGLVDFYCNLNVSQWEPAAIDTDTCKKGAPFSEWTLRFGIRYNYGCNQSHLGGIKGKLTTLVNDSSILDGICGPANVTCDLTNVTVACILPLGQTGLISGKFSIALNRLDPNSSILEKELQLKGDIKAAYERNAGIGAYSNLGVPSSGPASLMFNGEDRECVGAQQVRHDALDKPVLCVPCGKGYFFDGSTTECHACPLGTYQPDEEAWMCKPCPGNSTTSHTASKDLNDCLYLCPAGSASRDGREPHCELCPVGTYRSNPNQTSCDECPFGWTTMERGATSALQCHMYEWTMTGDSSTWPNVSITHYRPQWTLLTFVRSLPGLNNTVMNFSLDHDPTAAFFGLGKELIYIKEIPNTRKKRQFHHLAFRVSSHVYLFTDGQLVSSRSRNTILSTGSTPLVFSPSSDVNELRLHGLQISMNYTSKRIIPTFSQSCDKIDAHPYLIVSDKHLKSFTTLSSCDATDDCANITCGGHGTCIDLVGTFKCECDALWSGKFCQTPIVTDLCKNHQCAHGATCENVYPQNTTYRCLCANDTRGTLCQEPIVDGGWGAWHTVSLCSKSCNGTKSRERVCSSPVPGPEGKPCQGPSNETIECNTHCPVTVDGQFTQWSPWQCPVTCGNAVATRRRSCTPPINKGLDCYGELVEYKDYKLSSCPVDGGYTEFGQWSECSKSCDEGQSTRVRSCSNPKPMHGGANCDKLGPKQEYRPCKVQNCSTCPDLRLNPNQKFEEETDIITKVKTVRFVCKQGFKVALTSVFCGPITYWIWSHVTRDNPAGLLPMCTKTEAPAYRTLTYAFILTGVHNDTKVADAIKLNAERLTGCTGKCSVNMSSTKSSPRSKGTKDDFWFNVTFVLESPTAGKDLVSATDSEYSNQMAAKDEFIQFGLNIRIFDIFNVTVDGKDYAADQNSTAAMAFDIPCPVGYEVFEFSCVACSPGTYWSKNLCRVCPRDRYQNQSAQMKCIACPQGTSTLGLGSQYVDHCLYDHSEDGATGLWPMLIVIGIFVAIAGVAAMGSKKSSGRKRSRPFL